MIKNSTQNTNDTIPKPPERRQSLDNATATMQNTNDTIPKSPERRQSLDNQNNDNDMQQAIINSLIISRKK